MTWLDRIHWESLDGRQSGSLTIVENPDRREGQPRFLILGAPATPEQLSPDDCVHDSCWDRVACRCVQCGVTFEQVAAAASKVTVPNRLPPEALVDPVGYVTGRIDPRPEPTCTCCYEKTRNWYTRGDNALPLCVACFNALERREPWWLRALRWLAR